MPVNKKPSDEVKDYLKGVVAIVEATSFEKQALWERYSKQAAAAGHGKGTMDFGRLPIGYGISVGEFAKRSCFVSILKQEIDGLEVLFIDPTSTVVNHELTEEFLKLFCPLARRYENEFVHIRDADGFHNALGEARENIAFLRKRMELLPA